MAFTTSITSFGTYFTNLQDQQPRCVYRIPMNQRAFDWTSKNVDQLWTDVRRFIDQHHNNEYYLGNFITAYEDEPNPGLLFDPIIFHEAIDGQTPFRVLYLLDGQQRAVALTILAAAIRDIMHELNLPFDEENGNPNEFPDSIRQYLDADDRNALLTMSDSVSDTWIRKKTYAMPDHPDEDQITRYLELNTDPMNDDRLKWVQCNNFERLSFYHNGARPHAGNHKIYNHYRDLKTKVKEFINEGFFENPDWWNPDDDGPENPGIVAIFNTLRTAFFESILIAETRCDSIGLAYSIFGTINDRGITLKELDKLRNTIFGSIDRLTPPGELHDAMQEVNETWGPIWVAGADNVFLMQFWSFYKPILENEDAVEQVEEDDVGEEEEVEDDNVPFEMAIEAAPQASTVHSPIQSYMYSEFENTDDYLEFTEILAESATFWNALRSGEETCPLNDLLKVRSGTTWHPISIAMHRRQLFLNVEEEAEEGAGEGVEDEEWENLTDPQIKEIANVVWSFHYWWNVLCNGHQQTLKNIFSRWARMIYNNSSIIETIDTIRTEARHQLEHYDRTQASVNHIDVFIQKFEEINYGENDNAKAKILLKMIEQQLGIGNLEVDINMETTWLEHILPQNPTEWWLEHFDVPPDQDIENYIYSIGNMTILADVVNHLLSNKPFKLPAQDEIAEGEHEEEGHAAIEDMVDGVQVIRRNYNCKRAAITDSVLRINQFIDDLSHISPYITDEVLGPEFDAEDYLNGYDQLDCWKFVEVKARERALAHLTRMVLRHHLDYPNEV